MKMENKNDESLELKEIQTQLSLLKSKLDREEIVNDHLLRESMKSKMAWVKKFIFLESFILVPLAAVFFLYLNFHHHFFHFSWLSYSVLLLLCVVDVTLDYRINVKALNDEDFDRDNLISTIQKLVRMKRVRKQKEIWMTVLIVACVFWMLVESYLHASPDMRAHISFASLSIGMLVGAIIGGFIVFFTIRSLQKTNDRMIEQINEITQNTNKKASKNIQS